jgi:hypothetical protein
MGSWLIVSEYRKQKVIKMGYFRLYNSKIQLKGLFSMAFSSKCVLCTNLFSLLTFSLLTFSRLTFDADSGCSLLMGCFDYVAEISGHRGL